jgi:hypothetical protein
MGNVSNRSSTSEEIMQNSSIDVEAFLTEYKKTDFRSAMLRSVTCTVRNNTPSGWKTTIVGGGAKFLYLSGDTYTDGPRETNIGPGGSEVFYNDNRDDCCIEELIVVTAVSPYLEGGSKMFTASFKRPSQTTCLVSTEVVLGPKNNVTEEQLRTGKFEDLFDFTVK